LNFSVDASASRRVHRESHHRRPDVIEELNFRDGLHAAGGHADGAPHDARSARGVLKTRFGAYLRCQPAVALNTPPFPLRPEDLVFAASVGDVFTET